MEYDLSTFQLDDLVNADLAGIPEPWALRRYLDRRGKQLYYSAGVAAKRF